MKQIIVIMNFQISCKGILQVKREFVLSEIEKRREELVGFF
jgi:hypothetical protein